MIDDLVVQVPQTQIVEKTVEIPQLQTVEKIAGEETSSLRQSAAMLQAHEKQPENDVSGRVSESRKCFQLGTLFRDTSSEHSTHEHDTQSTHIEHHYQDNMCITTMTDDELTNDDEDKMGKEEQGGGEAIHARYGNRIQAMTEKEQRRLMEENSAKYVVYDGKIMTPRSIKQLKNHTIVRVVDRMMGGRKKKGQKKQDKEETTSSESDALQDMFMSLMKQDDDKGNSMFRTMMQLDDEMVQEALSNMNQAFAENGKKFGMQKLSFEAVRRFKEEQKQIMIEKERQARENEREKREQETMMSNERGRPAVQAHDEREAEKQQEMNMKEMKIRCGRYHGKDCETIYQEDRNCCQWVLDVETRNPAVIEFKNFIKTRNEQWEEECRERKRVELDERETRIEENRRAAEAEAEAREKERIMKQIRRAELENERMENRDNHNIKDDNDTKNFTAEAKGSKARADNLTTEAKGARQRQTISRQKQRAAKQRRTTPRQKQRAARQGRRRTVGNLRRQQETIPLKSRRRRQQWSMNKGENFHLQRGERSRAMR